LRNIEMSIGVFTAANGEVDLRVGAASQFLQYLVEATAIPMIACPNERWSVLVGSAPSPGREAIAPRVRRHYASTRSNL
jgi:hypothetical protein